MRAILSMRCSTTARRSLPEDGLRAPVGHIVFKHDPVSVAGIIADMRLDASSVCAALLHDVVEDCDDVETEDIQDLFLQAILHALVASDIFAEVGLGNLQTPGDGCLANLAVGSMKSIRLFFWGPRKRRLSPVYATRRPGQSRTTGHCRRIVIDAKARADSDRDRDWSGRLQLAGAIP